NQPFTTVENKHFRQMIKLLNPNTTIPVGDTIRNDIIKSFEDESINIKCLLQNKDLQSLQLDIHEWNKIREVVTILEIFVRTTKMIESAKYPMLASIIPIYNYLIDELTKHRKS
ncbi:29447_t:CDS:2, partial [Racocetra persica]